MPHMNTSAIHDWKPASLPDLSGRLYVITGGNSGIGLEAAKILSRQNADVVIAARNQAKGAAAAAKINGLGSGKAEVLILDLADMASIRRAAGEAKARFGPIAALINNAGVMQTPKRKTADGFEMQLGTNHLGHFLWTALMMGQVDQAEGRIVTVSSIAHKFGRIDFDNLMLDRGYNASASYNRSKLANLLFAMELHRRLEVAGSSVKSIACHPGYSDTALQFNGPVGLFKAIYRVTNAVMAQSATLGSYPTVLGAADPRAVSGGYYGPTGLFDARGPVGDADVERRAMDAGAAKRLWDVSEELVGETIRP
jgi:NAD(P)-dependent dehydrogenase (short-subunit alcohol dehydrogenase family)